VLETDAPYLAPVPYRGKRNESSYIPHIAARNWPNHRPHRGGDRRITTANAERTFPPMSQRSV
jgi:TatD DNase family protein